MCDIVRWVVFFFSSRRRHTRCALVTGVQTCALPISPADKSACAARQLHRRIFGRCRRRTGRIAEAANESRRASRGGRGGERCKRNDGGRQGMTRAQRTARAHRSEEHTSELQSLMRTSYAVFCLKKKKKTQLN